MFTNRSPHSKKGLARVLATGPLVLYLVVWAQDHPTLGPGGCGLGQNNCHASDGEWWRQDAHRATVDKLYDGLEFAKEYAARLGLTEEQIFLGDQSCMECHGTVVTGRETREADDGVSCESCHGPGGDYKEPHTEGDKSLGRQRPGYLQALGLGLVKMEDTAVRAKVCVDCHYITDQKLLEAGHGDGRRFNYISGIRKIAGHWDRPVEEKTDLDPEPFNKIKALRKPPVVAVRRPPANQTTGTTPPATAPSQITAPVQTRVETRIVYRDRVTGDVAFPLEASKPIELEPFPEIPEDATVAEILMLLKQRLELLYEKIESKPD